MPDRAPHEVRSHMLRFHIATGDHALVSNAAGRVAGRLDEVWIVTGWQVRQVSPDVWHAWVYFSAPAHEVHLDAFALRRAIAYGSTAAPIDAVNL